MLRAWPHKSCAKWRKKNLPYKNVAGHFAIMSVWALGSSFGGGRPGADEEFCIHFTTVFSYYSYAMHEISIHVRIRMCTHFSFVEYLCVVYMYIVQVIQVNWIISIRKCVYSSYLEKSIHLTPCKWVYRTKAFLHSNWHHISWFIVELNWESGDRVLDDIFRFYNAQKCVMCNNDTFATKNTRRVKTTWTYAQFILTNMSHHIQFYTCLTYETILLANNFKQW